MRTLLARLTSSSMRFTYWGFVAFCVCFISIIVLFFSHLNHNDKEQHNRYIKNAVFQFFVQQAQWVQSQRDYYALHYAKKIQPNNHIPYIQEYLQEIATNSRKRGMVHTEFILLDTQGKIIGSVYQGQVTRGMLANNWQLPSSSMYLNETALKHNIELPNQPLRLTIVQLQSANGKMEFAFASFFSLTLKTEKTQTTQPYNLLILRHLTNEHIAHINQPLPISNMQLVPAQNLANFNSSKFDYLPLSSFTHDNYAYFTWQKLSRDSLWSWLPITFSILSLLTFMLLLLVYRQLRANLKNAFSLNQSNQALSQRFDAQGLMLQELAKLPTNQDKDTKEYLNHITKKLACTLHAKSVLIISPDQDLNIIGCIAAYPPNLIEHFYLKQNTRIDTDWPSAQILADEALLFLQQHFHLPANNYHSINIEHRNHLFGFLLIEFETKTQKIHLDEQLFCHNVGSILALHFESEHRNIAERKLFKQDYFDSLTHLPNHKHLHLQLSSWIQDKPLGAVLLFGFDNLLSVNETYGREKGDLLLLHMGKRLTQTTQSSEFIARSGENRFAVLMTETNIDNLTYRIKQLFSVLSRPFRINSHVLPASLNGGVAYFPKDANSEINLLSCAERALQSAREQPGSLHFFDAVLGEKWIYRQELINQLHQALANKEFSLCYQPFIHLPTGHIQGVEALVRWHNPQFGTINPEEFIPLAEEVDLIKKIGLWVLHQATLQVSQWRQTFQSDLNVAVNVSPKQLEDVSFAQVVLETLLSTGLPANALELEITEMVALQQNATIDQNIATLQAHGISLVIDDFGSGYASFNYIRRFATRKIKIDRKFIEPLLSHSKDENLVKVIVAMGHALDAQVTAEGVNHPKQIELLKIMGCDFAQGFAIAKPLNVKDFEYFITHLYPAQFQLNLEKS